MLLKAQKGTCVHHCSLVFKDGDLNTQSGVYDKHRIHQQRCAVKVALPGCEWLGRLAISHSPPNLTDKPKTLKKARGKRCISSSDALVPSP